MTWRLFVAAGGGLAVLAALLPHGTASLLLQNAVGLAAVVALVVGVRRRSPARPRAWRLFVVAVAAWVVGDVVYFGWVPGRGTGVAPVSTALFVLAYGAMVGGLLLLARSRGRARQAAGRLDAGVVMAALLAVSWVALIAPGVAEAEGDVALAALAVGYPLADVLLLGAAARLGAVCRGLRGAPLLLIGSVALMAAADAALQVAQLSGSDTPRALQLGWAVSYVLLGAAALHPGMRELSDVDLAPDDLPSRRRVVLLLAAALAVPATGYVQLADGEAPWASLVLTPVVMTLVATRVILLVAPLARRAAELVELVDTDRATGLPNRSRLSADLDALLATSGRAGLLLLAIEHFAEVSEVVGRSRAEEMLRETARRLSASLGPSVVLARVGEARFAVIDQGAAAPAPALILAEQLRSAAERPHPLDDGPLVLDVAVGVCLVPRDARSAVAALRRAETALAEARERPDHLAIFTAEMADRLPSVTALREIRLALERDEIVLHYQPQLDLGTGRVVGVEALARWVHPTRGLVPPFEFLPLVERGDLVDRFTARVLDLALDQCAAWRDEGRLLRVAVNLSARNLLDPLLPSAVSLGLTSRGLPTAALELELTETSAMADPERSQHVLDELVELGLPLAVDDYGTGYSSLSYLRELSVRRLKIDRSFVAGLATDAASRSIVVSTLDLARDLGLEVVAEGVEDDDTLLRLRDLGCPLVQGFGIGRPVPPGDVPALIDRIEARMPAVLAQPGDAARALGHLPGQKPAAESGEPTSPRRLG